jgi:predicted AAA+ superfamily ATPase
MFRLKLLELRHWRQKPQRKPLIFRGARQVGKTYLVKEFSKEFSQFIKIDFIETPSLCELFKNRSSLKSTDVIKDIELALKITINTKTDLLFFDEIQQAPAAITMLKYFYEQIPELCVVAAGSYLGIMSSEESFPVGKVEFLEMFPMTFDEFLQASNINLYEVYKKIEWSDYKAIDSFHHQELLKEWNTYQIIGGMPEVVDLFIKNKTENFTSALRLARNTQAQLLEGYRSDFTKHAGIENSSHINYVFNSAATQLGKTQDEGSKKFTFGGVVPKIEGFQRLRGPISWLIKSRLLIPVPLINKAIHPLTAHIEENKFKLYFIDVGLLHAELRTPLEALLENKMGLYKGFIAENFVAQELFASDKWPSFCWCEGQSEIEFIIVLGSEIIPIEVKSTTRSQRAKSLDSFINRYHPSLALKFTAQNRSFFEKKKTLTVPIYLIAKINSTSGS